MIETSGVIEKEQGNGFYLVTLEQPAGHQCLCRAAGKLTKFRIKLLAGDKVLVEISPYDLSRGRITYRERNAGATGPRPGGNRPGGPRRRGGAGLGFSPQIGGDVKPPVLPSSLVKSGQAEGLQQPCLFD